MALTYILKSDSYDGRYLQVICSQNPNPSANTSTISWTLRAVGGSVNYYTTGPTALVINGNTVYSKERTKWESETFPAAKGSVSGSFIVNHNADGSLTIPVTLSTAIYSSTVKTVSENWELDPIAVGATLTSAPNFTDTQKPTITYSNPAGNGVTTLEACIADSDGWYAYVPYRPLDKTGSSYTFTDEDMTLLKNKAGKFLIVWFIIRTIVNGKTYTDYLERTLTMTENEDTKPKVTMTLAVNNPSTIPSALANTYIQGKSRVKATISADGQYGANISKYALNVGGTPYSSSTTNVITSETITTDGEVSVFGSAVDSRDFTGNTETKTITVNAYSKPLVIPLGSETSIQCYRGDGDGKRVGNSKSVWIKAKRSYYSLGGKNQCALQWRRKLSTEAWDDNKHKWTDLVPKSTTNTDEYNAPVGGEFELGKSYSVQIRAIDDVGENDPKDFEIPTRDVALHLGRGGKNVSIGEYCDYTEDYTFRSSWKAIFDNGISGTMTQALASDVLEFAESCKDGFTPFFTAGNTTNVPATGNYQYASGFVHKRSASQIAVFIISYYSGDLAINTYYDTAGGWLGWRYLKTTTS